MDSRSVNTFTDGMVSDLNPKLRGQNSYSRGHNVRLLHNASADVGQGDDMAITNEEGVLHAWTHCPGYEVVGRGKMEDGTVLFLTNGTYSEIGIQRKVITGQGPIFPYETLFNDRWDPFSEKLNFSLETKFEAEIIVENENNILVKWCDGLNPDRTLNLSHCYRENTPTIPYHQSDGCFSTINEPYPWHLCVHGMNDQCHVLWGDQILQSVQPVTTGGLLTGAYYLTYRYVTKAGYRSPVYPVNDNPYMVTNTMPTSTNHHKVQMGPSGVPSGKILKFRISDLDRRWDKIEWIYLYRQNDEAILEAKIFNTVNIDHVLTYMDCDLRQNTGRDISVAEITQIFLSIEHSATQSFDANRLFKSKVKLQDEITVEKGPVTIVPFYRNVEADNLVAPTANREGDVLTHVNPINQFDLTMSRFTGQTINFPVQNDCLNYRGVQFTHCLLGYRRGDTAEFAIVVFDLRGVAQFAKDIGNISFPQIYDSPDSYLTKLNPITNRHELRIMGVKISGVRFKKSEIYDKRGKLKISGFAIVRKEIVSQVLHQGILSPTVASFENAVGEDEADQNWSYPLPSLKGLFEKATGADRNKHITGAPGFFPYWNVCNNGQIKDWFSKPYQANYFGPDVMALESHEHQETDRIKIVTMLQSVNLNPIQMAVAPQHTYAKLYQNFTFSGNAGYGRPNVGDESRIGYAKMIISSDKTKIEKYNKDNLEDVFSQFGREGYAGSGAPKYFNVMPNASLLIGTKDFPNVDTGVINGQGFFLVNFLRPTEPTMQNAPYISTGHFQPINETVISQAKDSTDYVTFDDIEVFGGDTYVNLVDMVKNVASWAKNCGDCGLLDTPDQPQGYDSSHGIIFPHESQYNYALRYGRHLAADFTKPEKASCQEDFTWLRNGIHEYQPEEWNVNSCTRKRGIVQFFSAQPEDTNFTYSINNGFVWSESKQFGEKYDSTRKFLPNNVRVFNGISGDVTRIMSMFDSLYVWTENGFGRCSTAERDLIPTEDNRSLTVGSGRAISDIVKLSNEYGCQHPMSVFRYGNVFYWVDGRRKAYMRFSQAGVDNLSELKGNYHLSALLISPIEDEVRGRFTDAITIFDPVNKDVLFCVYGQLSGEWSMISYNHLRDRFVSTHDTRLRFGWETQGHALFQDPSDTRNWYRLRGGDKGLMITGYVDSYIQYDINDAPGVHKVAQAMNVCVNKLGYQKIKFIDVRTQNGWVTLNPQNDDRAIFRKDYLHTPVRDRSYDPPKIKGLTFTVKIDIQNDTSNTPVVISHVNTELRVPFKR